MPVIFKECRTIEAALYCGAPTISIIKKHEGEIAIKMYLAQILNKLNMDLNLNNSLTAHQIATTVNWIILDYYALNIADINIIMSKAIKGEYGAFYERLSPDKILGWFAQHFNERCEVAASNSLNKHYQNKQEESRSASSEAAINAYKEKHRESVNKFKRK